MQCDAINLVPSKKEAQASTTKKRKFFEKILEMFSHDGEKRKKKKDEHCRCIAKLPWQKEFQHFVPLSKAGKRSTT